MSLQRGLVALADRPYDGQRLLAALEAVIDRSPMPTDRRRETCLSCSELVDIFDGLPGERLQDRWSAFEWQVWPQWLTGVGRAPDRRWSFGGRDRDRRVKRRDRAGRFWNCTLHPQVGPTAT